MKIKPHSKTHCLLVVVLLTAVACILCGAAWLGMSAGTPVGIALNCTVGSSAELIPAENNRYLLVQNHKDHFSVALLNPQGYVLQEQTFAGNYNYLCRTDEFLYLLTDNTHEPTIITYRLDAASISNYHTTKLETPLYFFTATTDGTIYGIDAWDKRNLIVYTNVASKDTALSVTLHTFGNMMRRVSTTPDNTLYITLNDSKCIYTATAQGLPYDFTEKETQSRIPFLPARTLTNRLFLDDNHILYKIEDEIIPAFTPMLDSQYTTACRFSESSILGAPESKHYLEKFTEDEGVTERYPIDGTCAALANNEEDIAILLLRDDTYYFVTLTELKNTPGIPETPEEIPSKPAESAAPDSQPSGTDSSSSGKDSEYLESTVFFIDRRNGILYLPPNTTFAALRNGLNVSRDAILVKSLSNATVSSGNMGTGYTVALQIDSQTVDRLTIVVPGDINGTGTVNTKDVQLLYDHLNGASNLSGFSLFAADINRNEIIDTSDLLLLKQQIAALG